MLDPHEVEGAGLRIQTKRDAFSLCLLPVQRVATKVDENI